MQALPAPRRSKLRKLPLTPKEMNYSVCISYTDTGQSLKKWTFDLPMSQCPQGGMSLRATRIGLP